MQTSGTCEGTEAQGALMNSSTDTFILLKRMYVLQNKSILDISSHFRIRTQFISKYPANSKCFLPKGFFLWIFFTFCHAFTERKNNFSSSSLFCSSRKVISLSSNWYLQYKIIKLHTSHTAQISRILLQFPTTLHCWDDSSQIVPIHTHELLLHCPIDIFLLINGTTHSCCFSWFRINMEASDLTH